MRGRKRISEGGKHQRAQPYVALVEGTEGGVPFRIFHKRMWAAERDAVKTGGTITDLFTLKRRRWVNNGWKDC